MSRTGSFWNPHCSYVLLSYILLGLALLGLGGCQQSEESASQGPMPPAYQLGQPLADTSIAVVVQSPYGRDTMQAATFRQKARRIRRERRRQRESTGAFLTRPPDRSPTPVARQVIDPFVTRHVMWGEAQTQDLEVDSARLERNMSRLRGQYESEKAFREAVQEQGLTVDSVRVQQATKLRAEQLWENMAGRATPPSDSAVRAYRQGRLQEKVQLRHILFQLPADASDAVVDSIRVQAQAVLDSIQNGASFAKMARRHSDAPSAKLGGRRRSVPVDRLKEPIAEALAPLQSSDALVDAPVVTERGVHLLQLVRRNEAAGMKRGEAKWALLSKRRQDAVDQALRSLKEEVVVRVNPSLVSTDWARE